MKKDQKNKRVLEIADELQKLGYPEVATKLREAVTSGKTSHESPETNEGEDDTGGSQPPPGKERP